MRYELRFKPRSLKDLKRIPRDRQRQIIEEIEGITADLTGDIQRLTAFTPEYRLRVGSYRILFEVEGNTIVVYRVRHRREAYRK